MKIRTHNATHYGIVGSGIDHFGELRTKRRISDILWMLGALVLLCSLVIAHQSHKTEMEIRKPSEVLPDPAIVEPDWRPHP